jgi:Ketosteroid isomerase homolog
MGKNNPVELDRLFEQALNAGDIDALVALYEPQAALMPSPGKLVTGPRRSAKRWPDSSLPSRRSRRRGSSSRKPATSPCWPTGGRSR